MQWPEIFSILDAAPQLACGRHKKARGKRPLTKIYPYPCLGIVLQDLSRLALASF